MAIQHYASISTQKKIIGVAEEKEQLFWASEFGISIERLKSIIKATRSLDYETIRQYIRKSKETLKKYPTSC
jgi:hypothetical protein